MAELANILYTLGYQSTTPAELKTIVEQYEAMLLDIRYMPHSPAPQWRWSALQKLVGEERYFHIKELGNIHYNDGEPIELYEPEAGIVKVKRFLKRRNVILLCACKYYSGCHRTSAAALLLERQPDLKAFHIYGSKINAPGEGVTLQEFTHLLRTKSGG